jgi:hypothetical protein
MWENNGILLFNQERLCTCYKVKVWIAQLFYSNNQTVWQHLKGTASARVKLCKVGFELATTALMDTLSRASCAHMCESQWPAAALLHGTSMGQ